MITQCLNEACGDVDETLARSLKVSVKLANAYARRELLLDHSLQQINTALQRADPIVTMSSLIQQNDNLNGIAIDLVGTSSVKLRARVDLIPEELKAALNEKGDHLTVINEAAEATHPQHRISAVLTVGDFEAASTSAGGEMAVFQRPSSISSVQTYKYYLSCLSRSLTPGNEFVLWGWLQLKNSKTTGALTANLQTTSGVEDCHSTANNGWLVASLASVKDEEEEKEEKEKEKDIHFYFNIKSQMLTWKPSHTIPEPTYLEPDLLSWEEIERCIDQVNLGVPLQQTKLRKRISVEGFDLLDRLIRAWIVGEHYLQWSFTMTRAMQMIGENASLLQGICQYQALWRGFCMRRCYKAYLAVLRSTKLRIAATTILQFIRIHRRRRFIELTLAGLRRVLRYIRRFQALWRGFALRQVLTSSLALALNPMSQRACERPLLILVRLCGSHLVLTQADNIYNYQLDCFQAAQGIERGQRAANSRSGGNARKLEWTGAVHEEATLAIAVAVSSGGKARRWMDATSLVAVARALSPTSSKVANVSWLVQGAERLFLALFEKKGSVILPFPLHRFIREFIGLHIFYRYIHSIILAPDAFTSTITDSKKPTTRVERPQEMHRTTLAALSRLLRLVVENKGIAPHTEVVDQTHALNSLIKKWHVRFKAYLLNVIEDERLCWSPSKGKLQRLAEAWIRRLSCAKEVITEACNVTMNVEELVEVHRLINAYRVSIAPNPDDPLHEELDRVERLPQALYRHPDAKEKEGVISEDFGWKVEVTEQRPSTEARGLESFTLAGHITSKTRVAAPSLCTVPRKVAKRDGGLGGGVGGVSGSNINNTSTILGIPQLAKEQGDPLRLSFQANSPNHLANAYLYTARAPALSSTSSFAFASRICCSRHTPNIYSHAHMHTFLPTAKNCVFCASERIHRRPVHHILGWTEALPPNGKSTRLPGRRALSSVVDGAGMISHTILVEAMCAFSGRQMRNMRLDVVAVSDATLVGGFCLTASLLHVRWEEPEAIEIPHLLWSLHRGPFTLPLFSSQLQFNLAPFVKMLHKKFTPLPSPRNPYLLPLHHPYPLPPPTHNANRGGMPGVLSSKCFSYATRPQQSFMS
ncbi:ras GTP ase activating protein with iq motif [Echinococcus multilocularis]|uniref:Ras GTP ase activating protein with iq motif n=1 Tax=Echinococcus multilocularis TaxID=6211 RepID=A0A068YMJ4_ECHMU|nr:ras GTP ase activating protein with iq motif [Echinococcus multilocularis]